jgi:Isochorismatase family
MSESRPVLLLMDFQHGIVERIAEPAVVLAGISTSGVVLSTLRQAADLDYRITVLAEKVYPRQAVVTSTDEWIASQ